LWPCHAELDGPALPAVVTEFGGNDVSIVKAALAPRFTLGSVRLFATMGYYRATIDTNLPLPDAKWRDRGAVLGLGARWSVSAGACAAMATTATTDEGGH
jgi:hypothetical protein